MTCVVTLRHHSEFAYLKLIAENNTGSKALFRKPKKCRFTYQKAIKS